MAQRYTFLLEKAKKRSENLFIKEIMSKFAPDKFSQTAIAVSLSLLLEEVGSVLHQPPFHISQPTAEAPNTAAEAPSKPLMRN